MTNPPSPVMTLHDLRFGYRGNTDWLGPVNANITAGQLWTIVGPNGSGKTTLLKLLAGLLSPTSGGVSITGKPLSALTRRDRAQTIAYLPQQIPVDVDTSAGDLVLMGRFPFRSWGLFESAEDRRIAEAAIETTAIGHLRHRSVATLSGGEAHRAHLAAALAQQPQFLLLDEPTAALDLHHQLAVFGLLSDLVARHGTAVIAVTHDINLAARFGSHTILLNDGQVAAVGSPNEVLHEQQLSDVYRVRMKTATLNEPIRGPSRWLIPIEAIHK